MVSRPGARVGTCVAALVAALAGAALASPAAAGEERPPPSPYRILGLGLADPPVLDVVSVCVPGKEPELDAAARSLASGDPDAARRTLDDWTPADPGPRDAGRALRAFVDARDGVPTARDAAALRAVAEGSARARARACAWLELARVQLLTSRLPEARAAAARALRETDPDSLSAADHRSADHYRAESFYLAGATDEAVPIFEELARGATPVARAARLRLADLAYVAEPGAAARARVEALLADPVERVAAPERYAPRLAEWALADGDAEAMHAWLERLPGALSREERFATAVRRADALYLLGRAGEGAALLQRLAGSASLPLRQLAGVRLVDLESPAGARAIRRLEEAADSPVRGISLYARSVLAERFAAAGEEEAALDALVTLAFDDAPADIAGDLAARIDEVLASLAARSDCTELLATLGGRRTLLLDHAGRPDPFLQLGDCYLELGMARSALDVFRGTTHRFGPDLATRITLRAAKARLALGDVAPARAAARSNLQLITVPIQAWRLLYAEILAGDERPDAVLPVLEPVVRDVAKGEYTGPDALRALWLFAQAADDHGANHAQRATLRAALDAAETRAAARADGATGEDTNMAGDAALLGDVLLLAADVHRRAGDTARAARLYRRARTRLAPGAVRAMATWWIGTLAGDDAEARSTWGELGDTAGAWAGMARSERALHRTRTSLGRQAPAPDGATRSGAPAAPAKAAP